ncbi:hypothetical protein P2H44_18020 [Albimonas sp. CAU 1670]|uniref:hypothetical protein n=1 Tax=Albimonas sp. CAU 1670 TaxID=3032599 RepID=UPI0023DC3C58|nr:hypothetical protein [Albimonas sp. CAU 1670]MDF2234460.1 hypothetical protein [Albimonas sp. CAU 1670]
MSRPSHRLAASAAVAALLAGLAAGPRPAEAQQNLLDALGLGAAHEPLVRLAIEFALTSLRSTMDVTYDGFALGYAGEEVMITGLRLSPPSNNPFDPEAQEGGPTHEDRACDILFGRIDVFPGAITTPGETVVGVHDVSASLACLPDAFAEQVRRAGYERLAVEGVDVRMAYDPRSSALAVDVSAVAPDAVNLRLELDLGYFWPLNPGFTESAPLPSARFDRLAVQVEERGLIGRTIRLAGYDLHPDSLAEIFANGLSTVFAPGKGRAPTPETQETIDALAAAAAGLATEGGRMELEITPREELWLKSGFLEDPETALAALNLRLIGPDAPPPEGAATPDMVRQAMDDPESLSPERRRGMAVALAEGVGAPKMPEVARRLLRPLADDGDVDAIVQLAALLAPTEPATAYRMLLAAAATGRPDARARMDEIEIRLGLAEVIAAQDDAGGGAPDPDPLLDPGAPRQILLEAASRLESGREVPRNYERAFLAWTLAAALGDDGAALRRDLLDRRMVARGFDFWSVRRDLLRRRAFDAWLERGR